MKTKTRLKDRKLGYMLFYNRWSWKWHLSTYQSVSDRGMNKYKCPEVGQAWHISVRVKCKGLDKEVFIYSHIDCVAIEMGFIKVEQKSGEWKQENHNMSHPMGDICWQQWS